MGKNIALVLSSGGARGFAHIGAIRALEEKGYNITSIAGTSMGALVGGIYATGEMDQFEDWVRSIDVMEVLKLTDFTISSKGLVKGSKIIKKMKEIVPGRRIEDLNIPFCAIATDLNSGAEKVFCEGNLYDAIRASISIPTVFHPFRIGDHYYVDGGVVNPIPINRVKRTDGDQLAVVAVNANIPVIDENNLQQQVTDNRIADKVKSIQYKLSSNIPKHREDHIGIFNLMNRSLGIMLNQIAALTLTNYDTNIMIEISRHAHGTYDFYRAGDIIDEGYRAATKILDHLN